MSWDVTQRQRLAFEKAILAEYFPAFVWINPTSNTRVEGPLVTNAHRRYWVRVVLPGDYPESVPLVSVISPHPLVGNGRSLQVASRDMHTLRPDAEGHVTICHHSSEVWTQFLNVCRVLVKARIWLEAYEGHLATGYGIDYYLKHMKG